MDEQVGSDTADLGPDPGVLGPAVRRAANSAAGWVYGLAERLTPESVIPTGTREEMKRALDEERLSVLTHGDNPGLRALALGGADFGGTLVGGVLVPGAAGRAGAAAAGKLGPLAGRLVGGAVGAAEGAAQGWADTPGASAQEQLLATGLGAVLGGGGGALAGRVPKLADVADAVDTTVAPAVTAERRAATRLAADVADPTNKQLTDELWTLIRSGAAPDDPRILALRAQIKEGVAAFPPEQLQRVERTPSPMARYEDAVTGREVGTPADEYWARKAAERAAAQEPSLTSRPPLASTPEDILRGKLAGSPGVAGPPIVTPHFQTNIGSQLGDPEVDAYIMARSDDFARAIGGPQTFDDLEEMALSLGTTKEDFLARPTRYALMPPEQRVRLGMVIKGVRNDLSAQQAKLAAGKATEADQAALINLADQHGALLKLAVSSGSEYGRALNSAKMAIRAGLGEDDLARQALMRRYRDVVDKNPDYLRQLSLLDPSNPEEMTAWLRNVDPSTPKELIEEYVIGNILSALGPQERNAIGNLTNTIAENAIARPAAGAVDALHSALTGAPREVYAREALHATAGAVHGVRLGIVRALEVWKRGYVPTADGKFLPSRNAYMRSQNRFVRNIAGPVYTAGLRALSSADVFAKTVNKSAQVYADAARQAIREASAYEGIAAGLSDAAIAKRVKLPLGDIAALRSRGPSADLSARISEIAANPSSATLKRADQFGLKATFNDQTSEITRHLMAVRDRVPGGFFIAPFMRIADRMFVRGAEWTPGLGTVKAIKAARAGWGEESADLIGRQAVGAGLLAGAATLALDGRLSASAPDDPAEKAAKYATGWKPWAVRMPLPDADGAMHETWVPINQLGPLAWPIELVAAAHEGWTKDGKAPDVDKLGQAAAEIASFVSDQSYMDAWSKFFEGVSGGQGAAKALSGFARQTATGAIPLSGLQRTIAQAIDPRLVDIRSVGDAMKSVVPGVSLGMQARLDPWGEEIVPSGGRARSVMATGTPLDAARERHNPLDDELTRLGRPLGYVESWVTDPMRGSGGHGERVSLTQPDQYFYQQTAGRKTKELLSELLADPNYAALDDGAKGDLVDHTVGVARQWARMELLAKWYGW